MNDDTAIPLTHYAAASTSAIDTAQGEFVAAGREINRLVSPESDCELNPSSTLERDNFPGLENNRWRHPA
ncbi:hypothetical protein MRX96_032710 [Rhipicephalus microplus]